MRENTNIGYKIGFWHERSYLWWLGIVVAAYVLFLAVTIVFNIAFPAPTWENSRENWAVVSANGCTLRDALIVFYVCEGFPGATIVEWFRNAAIFTWYAFTFYPFLGYFWPAVILVGTLLGVAYLLRFSVKHYQGRAI